MSEKKPIMVRLDPRDYEKLREVAHRSRVPVAVLARNWISQQLGEFERPDELPANGQEKTSPASSPRRRSPNAKRRKNQKRGR